MGPGPFGPHPSAAVGALAPRCGLCRSLDFESACNWPALTLQPGEASPPHPTPPRALPPRPSHLQTLSPGSPRSRVAVCPTSAGRLRTRRGPAGGLGVAGGGRRLCCQPHIPLGRRQRERAPGAPPPSAPQPPGPRPRVRSWGRQPPPGTVLCTRQAGGGLSSHPAGVAASRPHAGPDRARPCGSVSGGPGLSRGGPHVPGTQVVTLSHLTFLIHPPVPPPRGQIRM